MEKQITDNRPPPLEIYHLSKATVDQMTKENLELKDALKAAHPATKEALAYSVSLMSGVQFRCVTPIFAST